MTWSPRSPMCRLRCPHVVVVHIYETHVECFTWVHCSSPRFSWSSCRWSTFTHPMFYPKSFMEALIELPLSEWLGFKPPSPRHVPSQRRSQRLRCLYSSPLHPKISHVEKVNTWNGVLCSVCFWGLLLPARILWWMTNWNYLLPRVYFRLFGWYYTLWLKGLGWQLHLKSQTYLCYLFLSV